MTIRDAMLGAGLVGQVRHDFLDKRTILRDRAVEYIRARREALRLRLAH